MFPPLSDLEGHKRLVWVLLAFALAILGLAAFAGWRLRQAKQAHTQAEAAALVARQRTQDAQDATRKYEAEHQVRLEAEQEVERLQVTLKATPRPAPAKAAPQTDPELTAGLEQAGLKAGLVLWPEGRPSSLGRTDAVRVWDWSQQAARVPALERRLDVAEDLEAARTKEHAAFTLEADDLKSACQRWQDTVQAERDRSEALDAEVRDLHQAATANRWATWGKVAGGVLAGYLAGRAAR